MSSFEIYKTRKGANAGAKMRVLAPNGKETGDTITVRGSDSDIFQRAKRKANRALTDFLEDKGIDARGSDEYLDFQTQQQILLQSALVVDWSFEEPCTPDAVVELLTEAPDVARQIDEFASKRERFVSASPMPCEPSPSSKSDSPFPPLQTVA
jgi:hypothetical protein